MNPRLPLRSLAPLVLSAALLFPVNAPALHGGFHTGPVDLAHAVDADEHNWQTSEASWYGPGLYGNRTACGQVLTSDTQGVAHRTLGCGTLVRFEWHGTEVVAPVIDRGPYSGGREWDLTRATCAELGRCFTAAVAWTL